MAVLNIKVIAKTRTAKDGRKFLTYRCVKKDGTRADLKFRQTIKNKPMDDGHYMMEIESTNLNRSFHPDYGENWWVAGEPISISAVERADDAASEF